MRAISLLQPFATLLACGVKTIYTTPRPTNYRGPIAIHASGNVNKDLYDSDSFIRVTLLINGCETLEACPLQAMIAVATLESCKLIGDLDDENTITIPDNKEYFFGDFVPGQYAYQLSDIVRLPIYYHTPGLLNIFDWNEKNWGIPKLTRDVIATYLATHPIISDLF